MDSGTGKIFQMATGDSDSQEKNDTDFMADWNARKEKLGAARKALRELSASEFQDLIRDIIYSAPTAWHLRKLILEAVGLLRRLSNGSAEHRLGIAANEERVIGSVHTQLARIVREFNVSLTAKSTPEWLWKAKEHPEFIRTWKAFSNTRGEQERPQSGRVIEIGEDGGPGAATKLRCIFGNRKVRREWWANDEMIRQETLPRISSNGVLQFWLFDVLRGFDESMDYPGRPLSKDWAERWEDEELYMRHFMPYAEREWNPDALDRLQVDAGGLLTSNNSAKNGKARCDFGAFRLRIKRLALKTIRTWRDSLVAPAKKV